MLDGPLPESGCRQPFRSQVEWEAEVMEYLHPNKEPDQFAMERKTELPDPRQ